jgi:hypothetical protein
MIQLNVLGGTMKNELTKCGCGRAITRQEWQSLKAPGKRGGIQQVPGEPWDLQLRICPDCGSTRAIQIPKFLSSDNLFFERLKKYA